MNHQFISNTYINGFITGLQRLGVDMARIEAELPDLSIAQIREGQRVDINLLRQIWHKAEAITQDPLLGYKIGVNLNLKGLGPLAPVLMHSPTMRISLHNLANCHDLISESIKLQVINDEDGAIVFRFSPRYSPIRESSQQIVSLVTSMLSMGRFMGTDRRMLLKLRLPDDLEIDLLSQKFRAPIEPASAPPYGIWFSAENADDELPGSDKHFYQLNKAYIDELLLKRNASNHLVDEIKSLIVDKGYLKATVDDVAEALEINKRSLQRQLTEEQTTFRQLKEEIIKERSLLQIIKGENTIEKIAADLGYSEVSAFHRAFKGWFGVTPKDYSRNPAIQ
ncbi:helix-turn-helix domain-containing protein [Maricurvus nonylphenolicus]|uniref:helix-turn-helix transcriptional regulator n=1 Tax=Maricurvus nonylphenolicus TaxID=1008307 RepID=UPI0036F36C1A